MRYSLIVLLLFIGCDEESPTANEPVYGCTDSSACNFNPDANIYDNTCNYILTECGDCTSDYFTDEYVNCTQDLCGLWNGDSTTCCDNFASLSLSEIDINTGVYNQLYYAFGCDVIDISLNKGIDEGIIFYTHFSFPFSASEFSNSIQEISFSNEDSEIILIEYCDFPSDWNPWESHPCAGADFIDWSAYEWVEPGMPQFKLSGINVGQTEFLLSVIFNDFSTYTYPIKVNVVELGCDGNVNSGLVNDECGVCGGDNTSCIDCAGTPNGSAVEDCAGICGGSATIDTCGNCNDNHSFFCSSLNFQGTDETLDIITWNIENYPKNNITNSYVNEIIDSLNVDIISLQEIRDNTSFNELVNSLDGWSGYRSGGNSSDYQEIAYLINTNKVEILSVPYTILDDELYYFAYREPYVLEISYNNESLVLINVHYKCCSGHEDRRLQASLLLYSYINTFLDDVKVIILGDFNDSLIDDDNNVFQPFLSDMNNFYFTDYNIANSSNEFWSFPSWPFHLDHILITNELFNNVISTNTVLIDHSLSGGLSTYDNYVSDHRPVGIKLILNP